MTRKWVGLSLSVKVSWLSWFNIRVGIGNGEWISMIWLRGEWWLRLGRYVRIGGRGWGQHVQNFGKCVLVEHNGLRSKQSFGQGQVRI